MPQPSIPLSDAPVYLVQLTDSHLFADAQGTLLGMSTRDSLQRVIERVRDEQPRIDLVLATGDLTQDGSLESYCCFRDLTASLEAPVRWLAGNHDEPLPMEQAAQGTDLLEPVVDMGNWRILMLNSAVPGSVPGLLGDDQLSLLEQALHEAPERHCLICFHHQPVSIDCAWMAPIGLRNADALFAILKSYPQVRALLWGHIHQEWDQMREGVRLLASPSTCIQFEPGSEDFKVGEQAPGYRWLRLQPDGSIDTGVSRVTDFEFTVDYEGDGY
ncbi:3',5'-cyclic-AMP phosphodiesterase [Pseudomonas rubra]|uniref:3',5'-cyclic-AMP phosphodiesterase n=1 Tax=Pseudomonas rubra TaxID=2942627 RepID=A0ABT5P780_9PSED|nr:3',5'-cyclic-AMP phosphodiesterase [Pseudomonas rubra]MDD1014150.1 3',5'-cyclic-AMP phosphodiesterase [Pseudomonas rubra]MDD1039084.1 3',5'-cyclic-AMP phosphodiesterase [Pseudomonas rubra]MDD1154162.1 3',5'-cyclic-AMP phosphodiesterase [Pseudomonas rubra]